jgi:hypothetical protein
MLQNLQDSHLHTRCRENLKSQFNISFGLQNHPFGTPYHKLQGVLIPSMSSYTYSLPDLRFTAVALLAQSFQFSNMF